MKKSGKKLLSVGMIFVVAFVIWTVLIQRVDVLPVEQNGTNIGFATLNCWFHKLTGVHMGIYTVTDWLGLVPIFICMLFAGIGFVQLIQRRNLFRVDLDIIILGIYYVFVILGYMIRLVYWFMFAALIMIGGLKVLLNQMKIEKGQKIITDVSIVLSIITVLFLAMTREAYAITLAFLLLIIKGMLVLKISKTGI